MTQQQLTAICNAAGWLSRKYPRTFSECEELEEKAHTILSKLEESDVPVRMFRHFDHLFTDRLSDIAKIKHAIEMKAIEKFFFII